MYAFRSLFDRLPLRKMLASSKKTGIDNVKSPSFGERIEGRSTDVDTYHLPFSPHGKILQGAASSLLLAAGLFERRIDQVLSEVC